MTEGDTADSTGHLEEARHRRKDKIISSREERLAKIMSLASGRTVDPKEVHLDRTPSPSVSERAAAGVGALSEETSTTNVSSTSNVGTAAVKSTVRTKRYKKIRHVIVILLAALFFCIWDYFANVKDTLRIVLPPTASTWQVSLAVFLGIESVEFSLGRLALLDVFGDLALYIFVILCSLKITG